MNSLNKRLASAGGLAALGGVAAAALLSGPSNNPTLAAAPAKQPVEVRTQVIRQTVHKVRREKRPAPPSPPAAAAAPAAPVPRAVQPARVSAPAAAAPPPAAQPVARRIAVRAPKRIRTRTSPTGGHGEREHEHEAEHEAEHEGHDD